MLWPLLLFIGHLCEEDDEKEVQQEEVASQDSPSSHKVHATSIPDDKYLAACGLSVTGETFLH